MAEIQPWERQENESAKAYEAFSIYRDMGASRSLAKVGQEVCKSKKMMEKWSKAHNWVERAEQWDREQDRILQKQQIEDIKEMRKRHANLGMALVMKAATALSRIPVDEIKAQDISRMVETGTKLERISRGDVGDVIEERQGESIADPVQFYMPDNGRDQEEGEEE